MADEDFAYSGKRPGRKPGQRVNRVQVAVITAATAERGGRSQEHVELTRLYSRRIQLFYTEIAKMNK